jgi:hypothetical protein
MSSGRKAIHSGIRRKFKICENQINAQTM